MLHLLVVTASPLPFSFSLSPLFFSRFLSHLLSYFLFSFFLSLLFQFFFKIVRCQISGQANFFKKNLRYISDIRDKSRIFCRFFQQLSPSHALVEDAKYFDDVLKISNISPKY